MKETKTDDLAAPGGRLTTDEEARGWLLELITTTREARAACDGASSAADMRRLHSRFLVKHGAALGALMTCYRCGLLSDVGYHEMRKEVLDTLTPTVITVVPFTGGKHG
jgi:hypothetical protein